MAALMRGRILAAAVTAPLLISLAACGGSSEGDKGEGGNATKSCPSGIEDAASTQLPDDVPAPEGADTAYEYFPQGATKVWYFAVDGGVDELVSLRDAYNDALESKGYEIEGTDQEEEAEAEAEFKGPHEGTTQFEALCEGKVRVRVKLTS
jgi:hypothetical protein